MGSSKSYRGGPSWQGSHHGSPYMKKQKGTRTTADGASTMSGSDNASGRGSGQNRYKSKSGSAPAKNKTPYGMS